MVGRLETPDRPLDLGSSLERADCKLVRIPLKRRSIKPDSHACYSNVPNEKPHTGIQGLPRDDSVYSCTYRQSWNQACGHDLDCVA